MKMNNRKFKHLFAIIAYTGVLAWLILFIITCSQPSYSYHIPEQTQDGWVTSSLGEVGMSEKKITESMNTILKLENNPLHSIIVVKDNRLVLEEYFPGDDLDIEGGLHLEKKDFNRNTLHCLASASKSVTSILFGIAIDRGEIANTGEKLFSYFPDYAEISNAGKDRITLQHLLIMSSGLPWDESYPYDDPRNDLAQMIQEKDPVGYVLKKPLIEDPGESFIYNSGTTNVLGEVIRRTTGSTLADYTNKYLFAPLGITSYEWISFPEVSDMAVASSLLYLRPRDMAKIGQLYLQKGVWNEQRIISESWVFESTEKSIDVPLEEEVIHNFNTSYGYQWWRGTFSTGNIDTYYAAGYGGQFIFVLPEKNMVIVCTAGQYEGGYEGFLSLVNDGILVALNDIE